MLAGSFPGSAWRAVRLWTARHYGLTQIAIVLSGVEVYELARHLIQPDWPAANDNAQKVIHLEQLTHLAWEQSLQQVFLEAPEVVKAMNIFYFVGHFALTAVFFFWLYHSSRDGFRSFRNGFLAATAIALIIHWKFPTTPPRLVGGYVDTLRQLSNIDIGSPDSGSFSNPVAAVPSLHAGWALGVGIGLVRYARSRLWRTVGVVYPVAVFFTIVVTGNHFVFDALAGVVVMGLGFLLAAAVSSRDRDEDDRRLQPAPRRAETLR
jgi:hypothetical protein